ncbi:MAG: rhamnose ABC transporter substrate-binding protein [Synergistaceae bacterium]|jgi:rhamnose transport system substrate-binding protein|nr:rhamnose ABC transporter substrate-binding protein [Synergistaceae bacterium]
MSWKRIAAFFVLFAGIVCVGAVAAHAADSKVFAFVAKDINNPYMQKAFDGFERACKEIGVTALYRGPESATPEAQIEVINQLVAQNVAVIAVAANDFDALQPVLKNAMGKGIKVISYDSAVNKESRATHVQQADPEMIGRVLIQAAYEMIGGEGGLAVLSATAQATNQNLWIEWMKKELEENKDKYAKTPLIRIVYGDDDPTKSTSETQALLKDPEIKVIIAPTTVGMLAAGKYLQDSGSKVLLTGLGLPSEMAPFIENGVCPWMYLWNPVDLGYMAAYTGDSLVKGGITGEVGGTFKAGVIGERSIVSAADGGTEVMLGEPFKFDKDNIGDWKEVY